MLSGWIKAVRVRGRYAFLSRAWTAMARATAVLSVIRQLAVQPGLRRPRPKHAAARHSGQVRSRAGRDRKSTPRHAAA